MAILTPAEAKLWIPGLTGVTEDTDVTTVIARVDAIIAGELGYEAPVEGGNPTIEDVAYTRYLAGPGGRDLQLPFYPIASITTIEDDPTEAFDGASYLVASTDRTTMPGGIVRLKQTATHGAWTDTDLQVIKAVWVAGFVTIPERLKQGAIEFAAVLWAERGSLTKTTVNTGTGRSITPRAPRKLPDHVLDLIQPYRLIGALL